ncbi:VOC family protein [Chryseolinea lacunae]|uniref:VOC family protein n=1 Tax=Chryseolinea lacunae TaxID=2801331 RepID=A0ABS1KWK4_9BACT|nr:VOC family protein [Chryseolinea lacunae]MBL0743693.1 VOC family protein [Chryseolinea lacunae]
MEETQPTYGNGKIAYLEIPTLNQAQSANFYRAVFGWRIRTRMDGAVAFDDGVNEVSGTWVTHRPPSNHPGILTYIMVEDIHNTIALILANGGVIVQPLGLDAPEITARFSDPSGNVMGIFQDRES